MTIPDDDWMVCAVCARGLSRLTDRLGGNVEWIHPFDVAVYGEDHPPVPALKSEIRQDARCDFCNWKNPPWMLPVRDFPYDNLNALGLPAVHSSHGDWAACDVCADLLNKGLWSDLTRRAMTSFRELHGTGVAEVDDFVEANLRVMYRQLRKNVSGSVMPNPAYRPNG